MKWNAIFKGVEPGKVCCNTPCKDADDLKCAQPGRCNQRSFFSGSYLNPADYGFGNSLNKKYTIGNVFQSIIPSVNVDNSAQFEVRFGIEILRIEAILKFNLYILLGFPDE